jgi:hypothetical protein
MDFQRRFAVRLMGDLSGPALIFSVRKMLGLDERQTGVLLERSRIPSRSHSAQRGEPA